VVLVPDLVERSLVSVNSSTVTSNIFFNEPMPDATYSVFAQGGKDSQTTVRVLDEQTAERFALVTWHDTGAIINPQTSTVQLHIIVVYQRTIVLRRPCTDSTTCLPDSGDAQLVVLNNLCTLNGNTLTILGGTTSWSAGLHIFSAWCNAD
jgi:hypothetical protein